ncbi:MAG TPA: malto-oligosyltrehalose trehalohydrolase [Amaricoccus sp.]|nr:malto-oligosyltrehalose trehalohydrolase [Amaricoccus sp.]
MESSSFLRRVGPPAYAHGPRLSDAGAEFRLWAAGKAEVTLVVDRAGEHPMQAGADGWFALRLPGVAPGARYGFRVDGGPRLADPASRRQAGGPEGWSVLLGPSGHAWQDDDWPGPSPDGQVIYELHVGTFTPEGTWAAAAEKLPHLQALGVTVIEMMPIAEFRGRFGWGYDGALPYAPTGLYGAPDDLRAFVDAAHRHRIAVILDVVYNHFGPGNRFAEVSEHWFTDRYANEWGAALNFEGPEAGPVRDYVAENAAYWIAEFHMDGLRLDATQAICDASPEHILARIAREARGATARRVLLLAENEPQVAALARPAEAGGIGLDALWNDDFHHTAVVALNGRREAYYHDYAGTPQELVATARHGFLYQGQRYDWQDAPRGRPARDLPARAFVAFLENHDQVANSGTGARLAGRAAPARIRALTALLLLGPQTPMLFQGQEFAASPPFFYFADLGELDPAVAEGRVEFLAQFPSLTDPGLITRLPRPADPATFRRCRLDWREAETHAAVLALHRDLLRLRRTVPCFAAPATPVDGGVIGPEALLLRFFAAAAADERLLLVNLGRDLALGSIPDPLFAPPAGFAWALDWSSESPAYGGAGLRPLDPHRQFTLGARRTAEFAPAAAAP